MNETGDKRKLARASDSAQPVLEDVLTLPTPPFSGYNKKKSHYFQEKKYIIKKKRE